MSCCGCFHRRKRDSLALSEVYYRPCLTHGKCALRSPLGPPENKCNCNSELTVNSILVESEYEVGKEKVKTKSKKKPKEVRENSNYAEFEFADDAISLNSESLDDRPPSRTSVGSAKSHGAENPYITVNGKEELPCVEEIKNYNCAAKETKTSDIHKTNCNEAKVQVNNDNVHSRCRFDGNYNKLAISKVYSYCTLPKRKNGNNHKAQLHCIMPPKRITPDGTHIYYWCDLRKKCVHGKVYLSPVLVSDCLIKRSCDNRGFISELDDGAYNPLWTMRGFTQTFHFWKENKRAQSVPLNAFLTYVTLPWWSIAKGWQSLFFLNILSIIPS